MYINVLKLLRTCRPDASPRSLIPSPRRAAGLQRGVHRGPPPRPKSDFLRDRYVRAADALKRGRTTTPRPAPLGDRVEFSRWDNQFVESPLGTYLSAVTFMKSGEPSLRRLPAGRLQSALDLQWATQSRVNRADFAGWARCGHAMRTSCSSPSRAGADQAARRFGPVPIYTYTLYFEVPASCRTQAGRTRCA